MSYDPDIYERNTKSPEGEEEGGWLVSYADLVTLLLCVFVLLFAMSTPDAEKVKTVSVAVSQYLTKKEESKTEKTDITKEVRQLEALRLLSQQLDLGHPDELLQKLIRMGEQQKERDELKVLAQRLGVVTSADPTSHERRFDIVLFVDTLFEPHSARLTSQGLTNLLKLVPRIREASASPLRTIEVSGHTDATPLPPDSPFSSNHILSAARAEAVSLALQKEGVPAAKITIMGKGASEPLAGHDETSPSRARASNERVVISILTRERK